MKYNDNIIRPRTIYIIANGVLSIVVASFDKTLPVLVSFCPCSIIILYWTAFESPLEQITEMLGGPL